MNLEIQSEKYHKRSCDSSMISKDHVIVVWLFTVAYITAKHVALLWTRTGKVRKD